MMIYADIAERKYGRAFTEKVKAVAKRLRISADWLMGVMKSESNIDHQAVNPYSGATGLIQFMPNTAADFGTTTAALKAMSALDQLDYVEAYYAHRIEQYGRIKSAMDLYLATFYPYAIGKPKGFILGSEVSTGRARAIANQNPGMDTNGSGTISKREFEAWVNKRGIFDGINSGLIGSITAALATGLVATGIIYRKEFASLITPNS